MNTTFSKVDKAVKTIMYAGNLGRVQQLDLLLHAWAKLLKKHNFPGWMVELVGHGALELELKELVKHLNISNRVIFSPPVPREVALHKMKEADILFISLRPDEVFRLTIPSKLFDCMLTGRPILAGIDGEGRDILGATGANCCYEPGNQTSLESSLTTFIDNHYHLNKLAKNNPIAIKHTFTRENGVRVLSHLFCEICQSDNKHIHS